MSSYQVESFAIDLAILKIAQRCNIDCKYCYVYHGADTSWSNRPKLMSVETGKLLGEALLKNANIHNAPCKAVELHGGEPLMLGKDRFRQLLESINSGATGLKIQYFLQTNAVLLDAEWVDLFEEFNVQFGVSLDGPPDVHNEFRIDHQGKGTHSSVIDGVERASLSSSFDKVFSGYLAVVNPRAKAKPLIQYFRGINAPRVDFLLPDINWTTGEPNVDLIEKFLIEGLTEYVSAGDSSMRIRIFDHALQSALGKASNLDSFGASLNGICIVESDGEIFPHDVLRSSGHFDAASKRYLGKTDIGVIGSLFSLKDHSKPCEKCKECKVFRSCRGGYLPHRFNGETFDNPSVYCSALFRFFEQARMLLVDQIPREIAPFDTYID